MTLVQYVLAGVDTLRSGRNETSPTTFAKNLILLFIDTVIAWNAWRHCIQGKCSTPATTGSRDSCLLEDRSQI